jgi:hypothetical protein
MRIPSTGVAGRQVCSRPLAEINLVFADVGFLQIVLQNSFWVTEDKFSEPWVWRSNNYVGDYATVRQTHGRFR